MLFSTAPHVVGIVEPRARWWVICCAPSFLPDAEPVVPHGGGFVPKHRASGFPSHHEVPDHHRPKPFVAHPATIVPMRDNRPVSRQLAGRNSHPRRRYHRRPLRCGLWRRTSRMGQHARQSSKSVRYMCFWMESPSSSTGRPWHVRHPPMPHGMLLEVFPAAEQADILSDRDVCEIHALQRRNFLSR